MLGIFVVICFQLAFIISVSGLSMIILTLRIRVTAFIFSPKTMRCSADRVSMGSNNFKPTVKFAFGVGAKAVGIVYSAILFWLSAAAA